MVRNVFNVREYQKGALPFSVFDGFIYLLLLTQNKFFLSLDKIISKMIFNVKFFVLSNCVLCCPPCLSEYHQGPGWK